MPWGAAIGAAAAIGGAVISSQGAQSAADTQSAAGRAAVADQQAQFAQTQQNLAPFLAGGTNALSALMSGIGLTGTPVAAAPGAPAPTGAAPVASAATTPTGSSNYLGRLSQQQIDQILNSPANQSTLTPDILNQILSGQGMSAADQASSLQALGVTSIPGLSITGSPLTFGGPQSTPSPSAPSFTGTPSNILGSPFLRQPTLADFQTSPGFQFAKEQGISAIDNSASARGVTGNTLRDLMSFGTGLANQDWWQFYNNFTGNQNRALNALSGLAGAGQNAAVRQGGFGQDSANQLNNLLTSIGSVQSAGQIAQGNAATGAVNRLAEILGSMNFTSQPSGFQGTIGGFDPSFGNLGTGVDPGSSGGIGGFGGM